MDMNYVLTLFVILSCALNIFIYVRLRLKKETGDKNTGWIIVLSAILAITIFTVFTSPGTAGVTGAILWSVFYLIPAVGNKLTGRFFAKEEFEKAAAAARVAAFFHPAGLIKDMPDFIETLRLAHLGEIDKAVAALKQYDDPKHPIGRLAYSFLKSGTGKYREFIHWFETNFGAENLHLYLDLLPFYMEALGQTGQLNEMILYYLKHREKISKPYYRAYLPSCRLYLFVFTGQIDLAKEILADKLSMLSEEKKKFWLAAAAQAAGLEEEAGEQLSELLNSASYTVRLRAQIRLQSPLQPPPEDMREGIEEVLRSETGKIEEEQKYRNPLGHPAYRKRAYATYGLMGVILCFFFLELHYGINTRSLIRLGAIFKVNGMQGEWWRFITSMFLHVDFNHIALNLLALFFIGPFVEILAGKFSFLLIYFLSGMGSMYLAIQLTPGPMLILLGASGCIMGLLGATTYLLYAGYKRENSKIAQRSLYVMGIIFAFQVVFDFITPNISMIAHLSGFVSGLVLTGILLSFKKPKPQS